MDHPLAEIEKPDKEVKPKRLQNVLKNVTKDLYKRNYELAETNKTLTLLRRIDTIALGSHESLDIFFSEIADAIVKTAEFPFVCTITNPIGRRAMVAYKGFAYSHKISEENRLKLDSLHIDTDAKWYQSDNKISLISKQQLFENGLSTVPKASQIEHQIAEIITEDLGVESFVLVKLSARQKVVGIMVVGFQQHVHEINPSDLDLIQRLGDSLGVAADNKLLFEENQLIVNQLKKANDKLKALDEAKDDFISMASHQLRTPLTSVKGYLSMVLEGDAGSVTKQQKDMLGQAFFSSQRMVYLIADLLNVSRLKTGKFVIEPSPVDLAKIGEEEVGQLVETAAAKKLKLTFEKPKTFPILMLDETKTRQVIMNFVDNAVYYTPAGGEIKVRLIDKPQTIELRVEDNGIGVPKSEQHHLFTKFYRAGNARKARPDGTGLGLFMAQKVVVAEGGSIIFESTEGKGSTFGFIFSKSKLKPSAEELPTKEKTEEPAAA